MAINFLVHDDTGTLDPVRFGFIEDATFFLRTSYSGGRVLDSEGALMYIWRAIADEEVEELLMDLGADA